MILNCILKIKLTGGYFVISGCQISSGFTKNIRLSKGDWCKVNLSWSAHPGTINTRLKIGLNNLDKGLNYSQTHLNGIILHYRSV